MLYSTQRSFTLFPLFLLALGSQTASSLMGMQVPAAPTRPVSIREAVEFAQANYPAIKAALSQELAAKDGVDLARTAYLPRTDLYFQVNRATRNNIFGLLLPNSTIPSISGPAGGETTYTSTFGTAAGALLSWELFDFGLRKANVDLASALRRKAGAEVAETEFDVSTTVANVFLGVLAAQQTVTASQANVERMQVFANSVAVLVRNKLRPGADESRARAELARTKTELIRAQQNEKVLRVTLAEWMGLAGEDVQIEPGHLLDIPPPRGPTTPALDAHPLAQAQRAQIDVVQARLKSLKHSYFPRFYLESAVYGRGTGARLDGTFEGGADGLAPSHFNWAVGLSVKFPIFEYQRNRVRKKIEHHTKGYETRRYENVLQKLRSNIERARAEVDGARRIAENTPVELEAARTLESQAGARYQAGLGTVVEVAEAQQLLIQAEIKNALARIGIWRSLFSLAAAHGGDMSDMLNRSSR